MVDDDGYPAPTWQELAEADLEEELDRWEEEEREDAFESPWPFEDRGCIGPACLNPSPCHAYAECWTRGMVEAFEEEVREAAAAGGGALAPLLARLPERFRWTLHNLVAHPLGEVLYQLGLERLDHWLHDATIPEHEPGRGRG